MVINKFNFCGIFRGAWHSAITPTNVISGFQKAGIYPYNRDANSCNKESEVNQQCDAKDCPEDGDKEKSDKKDDDTHSK